MTDFQREVLDRASFTHLDFLSNFLTIFADCDWREVVTECQKRMATRTPKPDPELEQIAW